VYQKLCYRTLPSSAWCNFREKPHVVFLQEVVPETLEIIQQKCGRYRCVVGRFSTDEEMIDGEYFVVMLLQKDAVKLISHEVLRFHSSTMGRVLLIVQVAWRVSETVPNASKCTKYYGQYLEYRTCIWTFSFYSIPHFDLWLGGVICLIICLLL